MEQKIREIIEREFGAEVIEIKSSTGGFSHKMFEVKISKEPYEVFVRFANNKKEDVNLGKEKYVMDLMTDNKIPVPKIFSFKKEDDGGYMVLEKFNGIRLDTLWDSLSQGEKIQVTKEIGKLLSKIHSIKLEKFGYIEDEGKIDSDVPFKFKAEGEPLKHSPYLRGLLKGYLKDLSRLISYKHLSEEFFSDYMRFLCKNLDVLDYEEKPVLVHGDFMTGHLLGLIKSNVTLLIRDKSFAEVMKKMFLDTYQNAESIKNN